MQAQKITFEALYRNIFQKDGKSVVNNRSIYRSCCSLSGKSKHYNTWLKRRLYVWITCLPALSYCLTVVLVSERLLSQPCSTIEMF